MTERSETKYFAIAEIDIVDPAWVEPYVEHVTKIVASFGGRYLARTLGAEKLEGDRSPPQVFVIIEFPSKQAAADFYESDEYAPYRQARRDGSKSELLLVPGEDIAADR